MLLLLFLFNLFLGRLPDGDDLTIPDGSRHGDGRHLVVKVTLQVFCGLGGGHKELVAVRSGDLEAVPDHQLTAGGRNFFDKVFENLVEKISTTSCQLVIRNGFKVSGPDGDKFFVAASKATEYLEGHLDYQMSAVPVAAAVRNGKIVSVREATKEEIEKKKKKEHDEKASSKAT